MEPIDDERPGRLSPVALYAVWLMAATFLIIFAVIAAAYLTSFLSSR
jgi:hypothetical protein